MSGVKVLKSQEAQVTDPKPISLFHADQASILQDGPAKSTAQFWWVSSLLNSPPLARGQIWFSFAFRCLTQQLSLCKQIPSSTLYYFIILGFREWRPLVIAGIQLPCRTILVVLHSAIEKRKNSFMEASTDHLLKAGARSNHQ